MKLAFSTLGCPGWSWDEIFATAKDLGLSGIEIRGVENEMYAPAIKAFQPENREKNLEKLKKAGMELSMLTSGACLGMSGNFEKYINEAKEYIDFASVLGVKNIRVMVSPVAKPEPADLIQAKKLYLQLCDYAEGKDVSVLVETNGLLANSDEMKKFMEGVPTTTGGILWDIHHPFRYYKEEIAKTYRNLSGWVKYVHVKDSVMQNEAVNYRMMGYGNVPIFDALQTLQNDGYEGYVSLEWLKRWCPDLQEPGIVFSHFTSYMNFLLNQIK